MWGTDEKICELCEKMTREYLCKKNTLCEEFVLKNRKRVYVKIANNVLENN